MADNKDMPRDKEKELEELKQMLLEWEEYTKTPEGKKRKAELEVALKPVLDLVHPQPEDMERMEK